MMDMLLLALCAAVVIFLGLYLRRVTVFEYQHALRFERGSLQATLSPGVYWIFTPVTHIELMDARPRTITIPGQELLSSDGVTLKVSLLLAVRVTDPKLAMLRSADYSQDLYAAVQAALRDAVGTKTIEEVLQARAELAAGIRTAAAPALEHLGIELESVSVKDIMFPGSLKEAFSQTARARQEAQAGLERARGETAVLRHLGNAARLLDDNPSLFQLRLVQSVAAGGKLNLTMEPVAGAGRDVAAAKKKPKAATKT